MNQTEKLATLEALQDAVLIKLADADPEGETFETLLTHYERLNYLIPRQAADPKCTMCAPMPCTGNFVAPYDVPAAINEDPGTPGEKPAEAEALPAENPQSQETPVEKTAESEDSPTLTKAEVRSKLLAHRKAGLNITALLQEFGCAGFNDIPAAKYSELLQRADELAEETR